VEPSVQTDSHVVADGADEGGIDLGDDSALLAVVIDEQMHEQFGAEILDDADAGGNRPVAGDHCLRPKADRCPLAAEVVAHLDLCSADLERPGRGDRQHVHRRRADKPGDEEICRLVVKLGGRVALLQESVAQDGDAVAHRHRLDLVVSDIDGRYGEALLKLDELCPGLHA
jgi:hypothetical protein